MPSKRLNVNELTLSLSNMFEKKNVDANKTHNKILLNETYGSGKFSLFKIHRQFVTIEADLETKQDINLTLEGMNSDFLVFAFVKQGRAILNFLNLKKKEIVEELHSITVLTEFNQIKSLKIEKNQPFKLTALYINKKYFLESCDDYEIEPNCNEEIKKVLFGLEHDVYKTAFNFKIIEQLNKLKFIAENEVGMKMLKLKSRYQLILAFHLEEIYRGLFEEKTQTGLSDLELKTINQVAGYIIENPGLNHLQAKLCRKFFISQSKLQQGFKLIHDTTVSAFTKHVRLKLAEELLNQGNLNVSEIVYTVGFTSRSYFSKIFKLEYGTSPTEYRAKALDNNVAVI